MKRLAIALTTFACLIAATVQGAEIGFIERFSLAADRAEALKLLIPGSEEYYYYHCLHHQNLEQFDQAEQLLKAWIKRYNYTPAVREIQYRQALLTYERDPAASLEFIRQQLGLHFNHQRNAIGEKPNLSVDLDQAMISRERLTEIAKQRHKDLSGFEDTALDWLVAAELNSSRRRHLLQRLQRPDYANLPQLIIDDLKLRDSRPFGSMAIHRQLLQTQLDELLRLKPDLLNQKAFVDIYLARLLPNDDVNRSYEIDEYEAYLDRLWKFVSRLAPVHNSLKVHVLYHRLLHDRNLGVYDKDRFMAYIRLPRNVSYIEPKFLTLDENRRFAADLNANFQGQTQLRPVGNDELLVRSYLHQFFIDETSTQPYAPYINDVFLRESLAETKIVNGLGEPEQWYSLLPPSKYQALKGRIDLEFAETNKKYFSADEPVSVDLYVKNVRSLIVRVFEINTRNFYRDYGREVNTNINLDGLVANNSQTYEYKEPPLRRVRRHFDFPDLAKAGVYVIDFIGNGMNSRVVVRKGRLRHLVRTGPVGHVFTILNEQDEKLDNATIWMAGREYKPGEDGEIIVPFSTNPQRQPFIIEHEDLRTLAHFQHEAENYQLQAGIYVDRESLLRYATSPVIVRAGLHLNGAPISLADLEDVRLTITSQDHDGVASSKEVKDFKLFEDRESVYEFVTPARLSQISFTLQARIPSLSTNKKIDLSASETFRLNQIDVTEKIEDLHFAKVNGQYVLDLRGKTGEPKPDTAVNLAIKHRDFTEPVSVSLQTDPAGRIRLGRLEGIGSITASIPNGPTQTWRPDQARHTYYRTLHGIAGKPLELPYTGSLDEATREELSLIELRGGFFVADRFKALSIREGMIRIKGLPRGDYHLQLKRDNVSIKVRITEGGEKAGYGLGARHLELRGTQPLQIARLTADAKGIRVQLANHSEFSRVHVFATRQQPAHHAFDKLSQVVDVEPYLVTVAKATSLYVSGRSIGDEYQYIIDRRAARKFPGVMVKRPSVLLNPWAVRTTEAGTQSVRGETDFAPAASEPNAEKSKAAGGDGRQVTESGFSNLDFLAEASIVLANLRPDDKGFIPIPRDALGAHQHVHVLAIDPTQTAYQSISLPEQPMERIDQRLAAGLDPTKHFTQQKQITIVEKGDDLVLENLASSRFETYDTLARVYGLYTTLSGDAKLAEFNFILRWPSADLDEKKSLYSKYACHELNFFLSKKDPKFFEQIVRPYLANKRDKTFLDDWLVRNDLRDYLRPWKYSRLNTIERILLSHRIESDREHAVQDVRDRVALLPLDMDRQNRLFLTALQASALESNRAFPTGSTLALGNAAPSPKAPADRSWFGTAREGKKNENTVNADNGVAPGSRFRGPTAGRPLTRAGESLRKSLGALQAMEKDQKEQAAQGRLYYQEAKPGQQGKQLYQKIDKTQEWAENNYYELLIEQQNADLVDVSAFWLDYAEHAPAAPFFSPNFPEATRNFTEMMFALSLLDLPFEAGEHASKIEQNQLTLKAASPMIVFHEEVRKAEGIAEETPILVSQNFFRHGDRYRQEGNQRLDKFVTDEFLVHTVYGCQIVITNPTSSPQKLEVLHQIPVGALPVLNGQETKSLMIDLKPYNTQTVEYYFYFPAEGEYPHYPVHVAKDEKVLAHAQPVSLTVVEKLSRVDRESWPYISQNGSEEEVLNFLRTRNLHQTDLTQIAFRMDDKPFFLKVVGLLNQRHRYDDTLWSYSIKHDIASAIREYLQHSDAFVNRCGAAIDSPLLTIDPVARKTYQHLDYSPLVNARVHQLGRTREIMNERLHAQYHNLLKTLSYSRTLSAKDRMAVTYYLLLQDRVEEAIGFFDELNVADLETSLQYDYFAAYLSLCREDIDTAAQIARRHREHPVDRWRNAFVSIERQIGEIGGQAPDIIDEENRDQRINELASTEPSFDLNVESQQIQLEYQNLREATINYYLMDIELLFSRNPFVQGESKQFSQILPNFTDMVALPADQRALAIPFPDELRNRNVLVEVVGAGQSRSRAYYSNSLSVQTIQNYGHLRVTGKENGNPLSKVYVKVYSRMKDGSVRFYKDGYTDLRGRFDYASANTNEIDFVANFAILIISDEHGAIVREASPPKR